MIVNNHVFSIVERARRKSFGQIDLLTETRYFNAKNLVPDAEDSYVTLLLLLINFKLQFKLNVEHFISFGLFMLLNMIRLK